MSEQGLLLPPPPARTSKRDPRPLPPDASGAAGAASLWKWATRRGWLGSGLMLMHMQEYGAGVALISGPTTDGRWGCAWTLRDGRLVKHIDDNEHVAIRECMKLGIEAQGGKVDDG